MLSRRKILKFFALTKKPGYKPRPSRTAFYWVLENEQLNF
ncbi:hypothetical protein CKA32_001613 [Geitlerinema sp. FC II]|nr:hypothetical protein CKA32_001613 [Geitlerinema sp. FC II]